MMQKWFWLCFYSMSLLVYLILFIFVSFLCVFVSGINEWMNEYKQRWDFCEEFTMWHFVTKCAAVEFVNPECRFTFPNKEILAMLEGRATQNRRQKVFNRGTLRFCGGLWVCPGGAWHRKIDKNSTDYSVSCFNLGGLEALSGGAKPPKARRGDGTGVTRITKKMVRRVLLAMLTGKRPRIRPRTRWFDYISDLAWSRLGVVPAELSVIAENREVFRVLLGLLSPRHSPEEGLVWNWINTINCTSIASLGLSLLVLSLQKAAVIIFDTKDCETNFSCFFQLEEVEVRNIASKWVVPMTIINTPFSTFVQTTTFHSTFVK